MAARKKKAAKKAPARGRGRPATTMTDEVIEKIVDTVRLGLHPERAARAHGVDPAIMRRHRSRNAHFAARLEKAECECERSLVGRMLLHTEKQWTAIAWLLERRFPEHWAKREAPSDPRDVMARELLATVAAMRRNMGVGHNGTTATQ